MFDCVLNTSLVKVFYILGLKGTLMQFENLSIRSNSCKKYPENFAFLILRILELFARQVCEIFVYKHTETIEYVKK